MPLADALSQFASWLGTSCAAMGKRLPSVATLSHWSPAAISAFLRGLEEDCGSPDVHGEKVLAQPSDTESEVPDPPSPLTKDISSRLDAPVSVATRFQSLAQQHKSTKYGRCNVCNLPKKPCVVKTGPNAGKFWLRCPNFWAVPRCWHGHEYKGPENSLPKGVRKQRQALLQDVAWAVQHGPQTK